MQLTAIVRFVSYRGGLTPAYVKTSAGKQILRVMKITAILLLSACMAANAKGHAQKITLSEKDVPLQQVFEKIEKQSGYTFAYTDIQLAIAKKVSIEVKNESLEQVLKICFAGQPFSYVIIEKTIVLKPKDDKSPNVETTNVTSSIDVSG